MSLMRLGPPEWTFDATCQSSRSVPGNLPLRIGYVILMSAILFFVRLSTIEVSVPVPHLVGVDITPFTPSPRALSLAWS